MLDADKLSKLTNRLAETRKVLTGLKNDVFCLTVISNKGEAKIEFLPEAESDYDIIEAIGQQLEDYSLKLEKQIFSILQDHKAHSG